MGGISVISWGFLSGLIAAAVLTWSGCWAVRHRRHRGLLAAVAAMATVLSLASVADAVNAHYQYLPRLADIVGARTWPTANRAELQRLRVLSHAALSASPASVAADASPSPTSASPIVSSARLQRVGGGPARQITPHPQGAVVTISVDDIGVGFAAKAVLVYLPPQYFTDLTARFPVVYLLHGSPGVPVDWLRGGGAAEAGLRAALANHPQILVMPPVSRNWLDDSECVDGARTLVETYLVHDLIPGVDGRLRTLRDAAHRTVAGMSAGGYCALNLGLRHRDLFGSIIDMSGFTHPTHSGGMTALFGHRSDLARVVAANNPDVYVAKLSAVPATRVYLLCGAGDHGALQQMASIRDRLRDRGLAVTWVTRPGGHTFGVWRPGLVDALDWTPH